MSRRDGASSSFQLQKFLVFSLPTHHPKERKKRRKKRRDGGGGGKEGDGRGKEMERGDGMWFTIPSKLAGLFSYLSRMLTRKEIDQTPQTSRNESRRCVSINPGLAIAGQDHPHDLPHGCLSIHPGIARITTKTSCLVHIMIFIPSPAVATENGRGECEMSPSLHFTIHIAHEDRMQATTSSTLP